MENVELNQDLESTSKTSKIDKEKTRKVRAKKGDGNKKQHGKKKNAREREPIQKMQNQSKYYR